MARNYKDYVAAAFAPLAEAAAYQHAGDLKTANLPAERMRAQFDRFRKLTFDQSRASPIATGGFVAIATEDDYEVLLVSAPALNDIEALLFDEFLLANYDWLSIDYDEAIFLLAAKELSGFLKLRGDYRNVARSQNFLDIIDKEYVGHEVLTIRDTYQPVRVYKIGPNNIYLGKEISEIVLKLSAASPQLRSPILSDQIADAILSLDGKVGCNSFNLEQAINAAQWRHAFLDIYRCLESLFFFPWVSSIKDIAAPGRSILEIRDRCRSDLNWNAKEKESISKLFLLIETPEMNDIEAREEFFKDLRGDENAKRDAFGRRVYFARNALVHHESREEGNAEVPNSRDYQVLTLYLCMFLNEFNKQYRQFWPENV